MSLILKAYNLEDRKEFDLFFSLKEEEDLIKISVELSGRKIIVNDEFYFPALQKIRIELIKNNIDLKCYGAMVNVYPSPMMMNTTKAYLLKEGEQAMNDSIIDIFDYANITESISPEEQNLFYMNWIKSL